MKVSQPIEWKNGQGIKTFIASNDYASENQASNTQLIMKFIGQNWRVTFNRCSNATWIVFWI